MDQSLFQSPLNLLNNYVPRDVAAEEHDVPLFMIEFWIAHRRVRIAEFRKEGEGKRSIYVNKEDIGILKDVYDDLRCELEDSGEGITYQQVLSAYPELSESRLKYLIRECHLEAYVPDQDSIELAVIRKSSLIDAVSKFHRLDERYESTLRRNAFLLKRDINNVIRRMTYITLFFQTFQQYRFNPVETVNLRFITTKCNENTRLEYSEGYNSIDILLSGEFNGLFKEEDKA